MRLVVTGCGRSGTLFTAELLNRLGVKTTHEQVFLRHGRKRLERALDAEVGWMIGGHLPLPVITGHVVRHPKLVVQSVVASGQAEYLWRYATVDESQIPPASPYDCALGYWVEWNERVEQHAHVTWRVEDETSYGLSSLLQLAGFGKRGPSSIEAQARELGNKVNHRDGDDKPYLWLSHDPELRERAEVLMDRYGY